MSSAKSIRFLLTAAISVGAILASRAFADIAPPRKTSPLSKLYLAETVGDGQIITGGKVYSPRQSTAFDAQGTVIETKADSHQAYVYSNGSGLFVDASTRVEIQKFEQEPFLPDRHDLGSEPSISRSDVFLSRGQIGICTGQLVSGTTMTYSTSHGGINIRRGRLAIDTNAEATTFYLLDGDATVRTGSHDAGGTLLRAGEMAVVRPGTAGEPPQISISPIEGRMLASLSDKVSVACNARRTVTFESIERRSGDGADGEMEAPGSNSTGGAEIVARPTVPVNPPNNITVSPARLEP